MTLAQQRKSVCRICCIWYLYACCTTPGYHGSIAGHHESNFVSSLRNLNALPMLKRFWRDIFVQISQIRSLYVGNHWSRAWDKMWNDTNLFLEVTDTHADWGKRGNNAKWLVHSFTFISRLFHHAIAWCRELSFHPCVTVEVGLKWRQNTIWWQYFSGW
jgi:hypothetical protein